MGSKFIVPLRLLELNITPALPSTDWHKLYYKNGYLKTLKASEKDVVLDRPLDGFVAGPCLPIVATDTVLEAFQKLQCQITAIPPIPIVPETFLDLTDTPLDYTTFSGYAVTVNATEDGLEFTSFPVIPSVNVFGIADTAGVYTYFSDLQIAVNAAQVNGTIEMFGDYSKSTSVNINKPLTINFNGYTIYDNTNGASFNISLSSINNNDYLNLVNGVCYKFGGTQEVINHSYGVINCNNFNIFNEAGGGYVGLNALTQSAMQIVGLNVAYSLNTGIKITNGIVSDCKTFHRGGSFNDCGIEATQSIVKKSEGKSNNGHGIRVLLSGTVQNSIGETLNGYGIRAVNATIESCIGKGNINYGIWLEYGCNMSDSHGWSNTGVGIYAQGTEVVTYVPTVIQNCSAFSPAGYALIIREGTSAYNCSGVCKGSFGNQISVAGQGPNTVINCTFMCDLGPAVLLNHAGGSYQQMVANCTFETNHNDALGAPIQILNHLNAAARTRFSNNVCRATSTSAPIFRKIGGGTSQLAYVNNTFHGTSILSTGSFAQVATAVADAQTNIFNT